jgi:HD superfamily phosphodiesterase
MDSNSLFKMTREYGGDWAVNHSRRVFYLVSQLAEDKPYNEEVIMLAANLHDWGIYEKFAKPEVDHIIRSMQVAKELLTNEDYSPETIKHVLECIEFHHGGKTDRSFESILFTDANALDYIGVVGTISFFSMYPRNFNLAIEKIQYWKKICKNAIILDKSKEIAQERIFETEMILQKFDEETFGLF